MAGKNRIGEENVNQQGDLMKIVDYIGANEITVEFQDEHRFRKKSRYDHFKNGLISNPFHRTVYGIGYVGEYDGIASRERSYMYWVNAMTRCYEEKSLKKSPSYIGCTVCEEWHYFKNFQEWFIENFYEIDGEKMMLDKDILIKNNREYSPNACLFVPSRINSAFVKRRKCRGGYPIGVCYDGKNKKYVASVRSAKIGRYKTQEEAFQHYKIAKERELRLMADEYKNKIPKKVYDAIYNYRIEIGD